MMDVQARFESLHHEVAALWNTPEYATASLDELWKSDPYRAMVALGAPALPLCMEALRDGEFVLARAVLEITGLSASNLVGDEFPSEQATAAALLAWWDSPVNVAWTAANVDSAIQARGVGMPAVVLGTVPRTAGSRVRIPRPEAPRAR